LLIHEELDVNKDKIALWFMAEDVFFVTEWI